MSDKCPRCKGKIALCSTGILEVEPDAEPFLDGVEEALDPLQLGPPTTLYVRACVDCGYLAAYWIDDHLGKDLVRQLARLQAIIDKLPKTADGVPVVVGTDKIFVVVPPFGVHSAIAKHGGMTISTPQGDYSYFIKECYSTKAAASHAQSAAAEAAAAEEEAQQ